MIASNQDIKLIALKSRLALICLQYIGNVAIPDHKPDVFYFVRSNPKNDFGIVDKLIFHFLGGFLKWDAHYFVHISIHGYTFEQTLAFFPLFPVSIGTIATLVQNYIPFISLEALVLLFSIIMNLVLFYLAATSLHNLTYLVFKDSDMASKVVWLFCFNPASIFFTAPYSECLFSFLTFQVMLNCLILYTQKYVNIYVCYMKIIFYTGLSMLTRSNGILNLGFIIFTLICTFKKDIVSKQINNYSAFLKYFSILFSVSIISLVPFMLYQLYSYVRFCKDFNIHLPIHIHEYALRQSYILPGQFSNHNQTWCYKLIPIAYSYVQDHYWNVGFLKYYKVKQIPNFILAAPVIIFLLKNCLIHFYKNISTDIFKIFTLVNWRNRTRIDIVSPTINVFIIHVFVLTIFCLLFVHVQVSTRMLCSASPVIYWYGAQYLNEPVILQNYKSKGEFLLKVYFLGYFIIGTLLFCNFFPWT